MELSVGAKYLRRFGRRIILRSDDGVQLRNYFRRGIARRGFRRETFQQPAVVVHVNDVANRDRRDKEAFARDSREPFVLHKAGTGFPHRGTAGMTPGREIDLREELARRKLGGHKPIAQDAIHPFHFPEFLGSWFIRWRQLTATVLFAQKNHTMADANRASHNERQEEAVAPVILLVYHADTGSCMCGIVGYFNKSRTSDEPLGQVLLGMLEALACAGPIPPAWPCLAASGPIVSWPR